MCARDDLSAGCSGWVAGEKPALCRPLRASLPVRTSQHACGAVGATGAGPRFAGLASKNPGAQAPEGAPAGHWGVLGSFSTFVDSSMNLRPAKPALKASFCLGKVAAVFESTPALPAAPPRCEAGAAVCSGRTCSRAPAPGGRRVGGPPACCWRTARRPRGRWAAARGRRAPSAPPPCPGCRPGKSPPCLSSHSTSGMGQGRVEVRADTPSSSWHALPSADRVKQPWGSDGVPLAAPPPQNSPTLSRAGAAPGTHPQRLQRALPDARRLALGVPAAAAAGVPGRHPAPVARCKRHQRAHEGQKQQPAHGWLSTR